MANAHGYRRNWTIGPLLLILWLGPYVCTHAADAPPATERRLAPLGSGDAVSIQVYGQPDMNTTVYVGNDGTIGVPLAGAVPVAGLTPVEAAQRVESALREGQFLKDPQVTITVTQSSSQRVSVLGEVHTPGRYPIDPTTTVLDALALAGGVTDSSADVIYILRTGADGKTGRYPIYLEGYAGRTSGLPTETLKGGDSIQVPRAEQFYIYGEVAMPNKYRLEPGTTVVQAIARAGGITARGSEHRVDIKRLAKNGRYVVAHADLSDLVEPDDVIHVKESIF